MESFRRTGASSEAGPPGWSILATVSSPGLSIREVGEPALCRSLRHQPPFSGVFSLVGWAGGRGDLASTFQPLSPECVLGWMSCGRPSLILRPCSTSALWPTPQLFLSCGIRPGHPLRLHHYLGAVSPQATHVTSLGLSSHINGKEAGVITPTHFFSLVLHPSLPLATWSSLAQAHRTLSCLGFSAFSFPPTPSSLLPC